MNSDIRGVLRFDTDQPSKSCIALEESCLPRDGQPPRPHRVEYPNGSIKRDLDQTDVLSPEVEASKAYLHVP